ncbi:hypothetical protein DXG01_003054 [Tephrocybe rancida]|nr:hypothetical protein DXG01_003054 [Tephrocybe rancida]
MGGSSCLPLAPLGSPTQSVLSSLPPPPTHVLPESAFKLLLVPLVCYVNWAACALFVDPGYENPFPAFFQVSGLVPESSNDDPRYAKSYLDILFVLYHIVFFSLVRQLITINACRPIGKYFGLRREGKLERFGEQGYAVVYFAFFGAWGYVSTLRVFPFVIISDKAPQADHDPDYPHWDMKPELKRYYLMQMSYWCQQLIVLVLGLEKPRKDYKELVAHHFVTLWLVGWSYMLNLTLIGNAVYMSMDIPDTFLAFSKLLNYIQWDTAKVYSFIAFFGIWSYFRHYLNLKILWSVWYEIPLMPDSAKVWDGTRGVYFASWMPNQVFLPIALLQCINLFWYYLMCRILWRSIMTSKTEDSRSDDEDDGEDEPEDKDKED